MLRVNLASLPNAHAEFAGLMSSYTSSVEKVMSTVSQHPVRMVTIVYVAKI